MSKTLDRIILIEDFPPGLRNLVAAYTDQVVKLVKERAEKERELAIKTTLSLVQEVDYSCALLSAIKVLGVSTDPRKRGGAKPRLQRFSEGMEAELQYFGGVFGPEIIDGLRGRLLSYGVKLEAPKHD